VPAGVADDRPDKAELLVILKYNGPSPLAELARLTARGEEETAALLAALVTEGLVYLSREGAVERYGLVREAERGQP
jgi:predicted transcriptional regulator